MKKSNATKTTTPKYKLTYFDIQGRAEAARLMFTAAGVPFEDCRVAQADWPTMKPKTPQGTLPTLEVAGWKTVLAQSGTINKYIAKEFGFYTKNLEQDAIIDCIHDTICDLIPIRISIVYEPDETKQAEMKKKLLTEQVPHFLDILEPLVKKYGEDGYAVGKKLTLADFILFTGLEFGLAVETLEKDKRYGSLLKHRKTFEQNVKVKGWLEKRPKSDL